MVLLKSTIDAMVTYCTFKVIDLQYIIIKMLLNEQ